MPTRNKVFISYAHEDASWMNAFTAMLKPAVKRGSISLWSDKQIEVGADWATSIDGALESAAVGLLLVTPAFFNSDFISDHELRRLVNLARTRGAAIYWVPISATLFKQTPLGGIQAACDPQHPLDEMTVAEQGSAIQRICLQIVEDHGFLPKVTGGKRQSLPDEVQSRLGDKYEMGDEIGTGKFSIVYRAQQKDPNRTVGVKVLVASEFDDWACAKFKEAAERAAQLSSRAFIKVIEASMDSGPELLITEFVQGEPLSKYLRRYPNGVPLRVVKDVLLELVGAVEEIHQHRWLRGEICCSNVLIERGTLARISAVDFSTLLSQESQLAGNFMIDRESLAYMTPERFYGHPYDERTDQYSLGLIAMELLGGERVPRVATPSDLVDKPRIFAELEAGTGRWTQRSPEFAGLVSRMLQINPADRWPSMRDVRELLADIEVAESDEEISRRVVRSSYLRLQRGGRDREVFANFYAKLFLASPDLTVMFAGIDMERQYKILNKAIPLLLEFIPANGSEMLRDLAVRHGGFGTSRGHYDAFLECLLKAMTEAGKMDVRELTAWRTILTPAIDFMCSCQGMVAETVTATPTSVAV